MLDVEERWRPASAMQVALGWQGGAKRFLEQPGEDALFQRLDGRVDGQLAEALTGTLGLNVRDRTSRDPELSRDFTRATIGPGLDLRLGPVRCGVRGLGERLYYKPDERFSANGIGATVYALHTLDAVQYGVRGGWIQRTFEGPAILAEDVGSGAPAIALSDSAPREDSALTAAAELRWTGEWLGELEYLWMRNESNSFRGGFTRHQVTAAATVPLPLELLVTARASVQRMAYSDPQFISQDQFIEEEGRSAFTLRLERALGDRWSIVGWAGAWLSPFGAGPDYRRQSATLGVAWNEG